MKLHFLTLMICLSSVVFAQDVTLLSQDITINKYIDGTLLLPNNTDNPPLTIIIAGSGPTDRDGNQNFMQNNSLKKLAEGLSQKGIATFRYDKRVVKQIRQRNVDSNIMFEDFITDAISVINYFKEKYSFSKIYVAGHSQGSLVGMVAAKEASADGFISIAGAGKSIDQVIIDQVNNTAPMFTDDTKRVFAVLKEGKTTSDYPQALASIFDKSLQPFMANWMQYNPQQIIKALDIPILILNGSKDLQVSVEEARLLKSAKEAADLKIIDNMNHVLFIIKGDTLENSKSYNEPHRKIAQEVIDYIANFIE